MDAYRPGDVANGHVLGGDGQWRPIAAAPNVIRLNPANYWARYLRRWKWTALAVTAVVGLPLVWSAVSAGDAFALAGGVLGAVSAFFCGGVVFGSLLNLAVAAIPSSRSAMVPR